MAGFSRLNYKNRKKFKKINKSSGGIALFAKPGVANLLEPFETGNKDIIWTKLKKQHHDNPNDIYIGSLYISEENNTKSISEKIRNIAEDIEKIKKGRRNPS